MNLVIDIGNTRTKVVLFDQQNVHQTTYFNNYQELLHHQSLFSKATHCIIGSVVSHIDELYLVIKTHIPTTIFFKADTKTPLTNLYQSATTLGSDRIAASVGAYGLYPNANVLVIDAGTCIKYNFTNAQNQYLGGAISPGIPMKLKALAQHTSRLPLVTPNFSYHQLIGDNTQNSILSGVLMGSVAEIDGMINLFKAQYPDVICVLTGGDSEYLAKQLKNRIFVRQNLVAKGLNDILNYTIEHSKG
ncbi:MAG: type III pantothenate kinase [Chitinophagaceae bacterium]|nr:type III pantothenate kinase [Chitinophagaceae bacterium]